MLEDQKIQKLAREIRNKLEIILADESSYIIIVAISKNPNNNIISKISCKNGKPISGYTYDSNSDSYLINCADYLNLGYIPITSKVLIDKSTEWVMRIPLPEDTIKKYLTPLQKKELKNFSNNFKTEDFDLQFIQMIDPND